MALISFANGAAIDASQVQQLINLLTGAMNDQPVTLKGDYATVAANLRLSSLTAATKGGALAFADAGASKWEFSKSASQSLDLWDFTRSAFVLSFAPNGDISLPSTAKLLGSADFRTAARLIAGADPGGGGFVSGDIIANRGGAAPGTGAIFFGSSVGSHYLYYDGAKFNLTDQLDLGTHSLTGATDMTGTGIVTGGILKATGAPSLGSPVTGRYVGNWSTLGAPTGLTGAVGDFGFDGNFNLWVCTAAGTPGTWRPRGSHIIDDQLLAATAAAFTSVTIPAGYDWIRIRISLRSAATVGAGTAEIQFNGDTTATYTWQNLQGSSTGAAGSDQGAANVTAAACAVFPGSGAPAGLFTTTIIDIHDVSNTARSKTFVAISGEREATTAAGASRVNALSGSWTPGTQAAMTGIKIFPATGSWAAGCRMLIEAGAGI